MRLRTVSLFSLVVIIFLVSPIGSRSVSATPIHHPPPVDWTRTYGGPGSQSAYAVDQTLDGGYMLFGNNYFDQSTKSRVIRTDSSGNVIWDKTDKSADPWRFGKAMHQTSDLGYVIVSTRSAVENAYEGNVLFKIDENGNELWNRTYQIEGYMVFFTCISETNDGGFLLGGYAYPPSTHKQDFCIAKVDQDGMLEWTKTYSDGSDDNVAGVVQTSDGGYLLVGVGAGLKAWIVKTDETGNIVWNETLGSTERNIFQSVVRTSDDAYVLAGVCGWMSWQAWLVKIDINGTVQWERQYGDANGGIERRADFWCVQQIDDGFIAVGQYAGESLLVRTDLNGYMLWNTTYGMGHASSVIMTNDGGYMVAGETPANGADMLLIKTMWANAPVATFAYSPTNASVQEEIVFNASSSFDWDVDIVSYRWDFDDGNISSTSDAVISHAFVSPGIYNVTLTVTNSLGLDSSSSETVWVRMPTYIDMSIVDWAFVGFEIPVSGKLYDVHGNYLKNENVTLWRNVGGSTWALLGSDITDDFGNYVIDDWTPTAVMTYIAKVMWSGNQTFFPAESTRTISIRSIPTRISLALSSSTSLIGFQVRITGDLMSDIGAVSNTPVLLSYSVTGGQTWIDMTLAYTESDGGYSAVWMPSATGNYLVKASWAGNSTYPKASETVSLAVIPSEEQSVFLVISNSTVSELSFESAHRELAFTVEGTSGTMGYADVYIAKTLIGNIEGVEVKLNGTEIEYTATSLDDSWLIHFTFQHSAHAVSVNLGDLTAATDGTIWIDPMRGALFIAALAVGVVAAVVLIRRRRLRKKK